ncbi:MAG TPA: DUF6049 family protein [Iamia sp.]|jgi:hypothetical protein|nr:DUF6049 family protein [Iamia sp.]
MTPLRRLAGAVAVATAVGLVGPLPAPPVSATAAPPLADQAEPTVDIRGLEQTAWVTRVDTWALRLAVTGAPAGSTVTAELHSRVADRSAYDASFYGVFEDDPESSLPASLPDVDLDEAERLPDGSRSVSLAVSLRQDPPATTRPGWQFFSSGLRPGVYPVDVRVLDPDGVEQQRLIVHLTRVPSDEEEGVGDTPVLVAPVISLGAAPTIEPDGDADPDPALARQIDDLTDGLAMGGPLPFTLVPRPESIEALARDEEAADSLEALQRVARARQVVDGPYVEVPVGAWVEQGLTEELTRQRDRGNGILTEQLGHADSSTWDGRSDFTPAAAAALWPVGVRRTILAPGALGPEPVTGPVTIPAGPGRTLQAVVVDANLAAALTRQRDPVLNVSGLAAELALLATATDGAQGVVVAPTADWLADPSNIALLSGVLRDPAAPVEAATVAELLETVPSVGLRDLAATISPDLDDHPERLGLARARLSSYASLVGSATTELGALDQRLLISGSTALTPRERSAYVEKVLVVTEERFQAVRSPEPRQTVTLTSSDGDVPLTLVNDLDVPATVTVDLSTNERVEIRQFSRTQILEPGTNQLSIPVHTRAPGDSTIEITVRTTDGAVDIDEIRYTVRSTAVPGIGIVLTAGAVLFLLVWWARHWLRDRRARGGGGGGGGGDGPDPVEPPPESPHGAVVPTDPELVST